MSLVRPAVLTALAALLAANTADAQALGKAIRKRPEGGLRAPQARGLRPRRPGPCA
jgi:hypothetical protein